MGGLFVLVGCCCFYFSCCFAFVFCFCLKKLWWGRGGKLAVCVSVVSVSVLSAEAITCLHISSHSQTCLLLRFWRKVYALKALFTLLRLSFQILRFSAAVSDFRLPTIDLCEKFICEDGDRMTI